MREANIDKVDQYLSDVFRKNSKGYTPISITLQPDDESFIPPWDRDSNTESNRTSQPSKRKCK